MNKFISFILATSIFISCTDSKKETTSSTVSDDNTTATENTGTKENTASAGLTGSGTATGTGVSRFDVKMTDEQNAAIPDVANGLPVLAGTTWAVISIYKKGTTPTTQHRPGNFLFCKNGKWEHQTGSLFLGGNYSVKGATLTTDEGNGVNPSDWKLTWDGSVKEMEMEQGNTVFVLRYQGKTQC